MPQDTRSLSPPTPARQQSWPALRCRMDSPPDLGESSRARSSRLAGRRTAWGSTGGETGP